METKNLPVSKNIILIPLLLITVFTIVGIGLIDFYFYRTAIDRTKDDLTRLALSGTKVLEFLDGNAELEDFDNFADAFAENSRFRVTIIDLAGVVLGDSRLSHQEIRQIENHADRLEILEAKKSGIGISRRYSNTLNIDLLYVAARYNSLGHKGYFRVALPLTDLENALMRQHLILAVFCFFGLIIAAFLSLIASRYLLLLVRKSEEHLERQVSKRKREIETLQNLATQLTACNSMKEALEVIRLITSILLPRFAGTLALYRSSKDKLEIVENWNGQWKGEKIYSPDQCWALRSGKPHLGDPDAGNMTCNHSDNQEDKMLCIPIVAQGVTYGVLHFTSPQKTEWTIEEYQLTSAVAEHASLTLANLELRESLRQ